MNFILYYLFLLSINYYKKLIYILLFLLWINYYYIILYYLLLLEINYIIY